MNFVAKLVFCLILSLFSIFTTAETKPYRELPAVKIKSHHFPGGICYVTRSHLEPDMVTYITAYPEYMNTAKIEICLNRAKKTKWESVKIGAASEVNTLREARTNNMTCTQFGIIQAPIMFQVKFSEYTKTGKADELEQCVHDMLKSKDLVIESQRPPHQFVPQNL